MGTRSAIIVKVGSKYKGIYCHWDGYPEGRNGVGFMLANHYNTQERAEALVALGDISSLKENLAPPEGVIHTFDKPYCEDPKDNYARSKVTVAYGRDRGENDPSVCKPKVGKSIKSVECQICDFAYTYVFSNGEWKVGRSKLSKFQG